MFVEICYSSSMKENKKMSITLKIGLVIVGLVVLYIIVGLIMVFVFDTKREGLELSCPTCDTNLANLSDCYKPLEALSDNQDFISFRNSVGIPFNDKIDKIVKTISPDDGSVYCTYYARPELDL